MENYFKHETALIAKGAQIGRDTRIWAFSNIQDGVIIGESCNIADHCYVEKGVRIGNFVTVKNGVSIFEGVILEDDVFCGTNTVFVNDRHPRSHRKDKWKMEQTIVKKGATIGSNATILCGITIGEYAFIGAGSVVTKDIPPYTLVAGNPARQLGFVCSCGKKLNQNLKCICGQTYRQEQKGLVLDE